MKVMIFIAGLLAGTVCVVLFQQAQTQSEVTVNKETWNEIIKKSTEYEKLEAEIREIKQKLIEKETVVKRLQGYILDRETILKLKDDELLKLIANPGNGAATEQPSLSPEKVREKISQLKAKFDLAISNNDGETVLQTIKELLALGDESYKIIADIWLKVAEDFSGDNKLKLSHIQFRTSLSDVNFIKWTLGTHGMDKRLKRYAAMAIPWLDYKAAPGMLASLLRTEKDGGLIQQLVRQLGEVRSLDAQNALIEKLGQSKDQWLNREIIFSLANYEGQDVTNLLTQYAYSNDAQLSNTAKTALMIQNPPVTGYVVTSVPKGQMAEASGLKQGDVIIGFNNKPISSSRDYRELGETVRKAKENEVIVISVYREGALQTVTVKKGRLGLDGRFVKQKV